MSLLLTVVAGLWLSLRVQAQCDGPSITVSSSTEAQSIANCETYDGDVIIDSSAPGSIELNGVRSISGDLTVENASSLTSVSADSLETIQGSFTLSNLTILSSLQFPSLTAVNRIRWDELPALQALDFTAGVSRANQVVISNTQLSHLSGLELATVGRMDIFNNSHLTTVNLDTLANITQALSFSANEINLKLSLMNLESAANITVRNVSALYASSLTEVSGAFAIYSSYMKSLVFPALVSTGNTLAVVDCPNLNNLSMNALTKIGGGFVLRNNTDLPTIDLPNLDTVSGRIQFRGTFDAVSMPSLTDVRGNVEVQSTSSNDTICDTFQNASSDNIIRGQLTCKTSQPKASTDGNSTTTTTTSSDKPDPSASSTSSNSSDSPPRNVSSPTAAIAGIVISGIVAVTLIALATWYFCIKRKRLLAASPDNNLQPTDSELPFGGHHEKTELPAQPNQVSELQGDRQHMSHQLRSKKLPSVSVIPGNSTNGTVSGPSSSSSREGTDGAAHGAATITNPSELAWDQHEPSHELHGSDVPELRVERASRAL